jgi:hypothetical protein
VVMQSRILEMRHFEVVVISSLLVAKNSDNPRTVSRFIDAPCTRRDLGWANPVFFAFFSFNRINNLRVFSVGFSSIPTAPTISPVEFVRRLFAAPASQRGELGCAPTDSPRSNAEARAPRFMPVFYVPATRQNSEGLALFFSQYYAGRTIEPECDPQASFAVSASYGQRP